MTKQHNESQKQDRRASRLAFTLIELLVTIAIIGMLAAVSLGAFHAARQAAREASTKALIAKLDHVISQRCNSYVTRRVRVDTRDIRRDDDEYMEKVARRRLGAIRDLMRMELPERWPDVLDPPRNGKTPRPSVSHTYKWQLDAAKQKHPDEVVAEFAPAECLYMIVASTPEAMAHFRQREIGDADEDGLREFHDAWGRPIMFLRWAPGFSPVSAIQTGDPDEDHDPFDSRQVDPGAYRLVPLIYSGGRDKQYDLAVDKNYRYQGDPYASGDGAPFDEDGDGLDHHDNIHNHNITQK